MKAVEDEFHFIMKCPFYVELRAKLLSNISDIYNTDTLVDSDIFILIMSASEYDCILPVTEFVNSAFISRTNIDV